MSFDYENMVVARIEVSRIRGGPAAGKHRILVDARFNIPAWPSERTVSVSELGGELALRVKGTPRPLGRLQPAFGSRFVETSPAAMERELTFGTELGRGAMEEIEAARSGGSVTFNLSIFGVAAGNSGFREVSYQVDYPVNQGTWVEVLNSTGFMRVMLIEIPIPDPDQSPRLAQATSYLAEAQQAIVQGRYRDAVGSCRDVLESLSDAVGDEDQKDDSFDVLFENARMMGKEQRYRALRRAMKVLTHPARHATAVADQSGWDRLDALSLVTMAATLLRRFGGGIDRRQ